MIKIEELKGWVKGEPKPVQKTRRTQTAFLHFQVITVEGVIVPVKTQLNPEGYYERMKDGTRVIAKGYYEVDKYFDGSHQRTKTTFIADELAVK